MEYTIKTRQETGAILYNLGDSEDKPRADPSTSAETLIDWIFEFVDNTLDYEMVRRIFDEGFVTDDNDHRIADEEDIYITLWTFMANDVCNKAIDSLNLHSVYDEAEMRDRVDEFLCANEEEIQVILTYKARKILSDENIMYETRGRGGTMYVNPIQTYIMRGV